MRRRPNRTDLADAVFPGSARCAETGSAESRPPGTLARCTRPPPGRRQRAQARSLFDDRPSLCGRLREALDTASAKQNAKAQQDAFLSSARALDPNARVVARVQAVMNAVFIEVDAAALPALAKDPRVVRIAPVGNYQLDLSTTVPYIGATAVQAKGVDGRGIKVAVLDSGIDYLHAALWWLGQSRRFRSEQSGDHRAGHVPDREGRGRLRLHGTRTGPALTGSPPEAPDPDPLDAGTGSAVMARTSPTSSPARAALRRARAFMPSRSVRPISTSCSGIALIQGMDFAADPNGDGKLNDRVDIINMSLGSPYGQPFDDDLSAAVDNATAVGILTVASAGNSIGQAVRRPERRAQRRLRCQSRRPPFPPLSCR